MRTNIELDGGLIEQALKISGFKTKKDIVNEVLISDIIDKRNWHALVRRRNSYNFRIFKSTLEITSH